MLIFDLGIALTRSPTGLQEKLAESADHHFYLFKVIANTVAVFPCLYSETLQCRFQLRRKGIYVTFAKLNIVVS